MKRKSSTITNADYQGSLQVGGHSGAEGQHSCALLRRVQLLCLCTPVARSTGAGFARVLTNAAALLPVQRGSILLVPSCKARSDSKAQGECLLCSQTLCTHVTALSAVCP